MFFFSLSSKKLNENTKLLIKNEKEIKKKTYTYWTKSPHIRKLDD